MNEGIPQSDLMLPLQFEFDEVDTETEGYQLSIQGLDDLTIMEDYGVVIADGKLVKQKADPLRRLSELKRMVEVHHRRKVQIAPEQMESFMDKVVPGLMKLGRVHMTRSVSDRVTQQPLKVAVSGPSKRQAAGRAGVPIWGYHHQPAGNRCTNAW